MGRMATRLLGELVALVAPPACTVCRVALVRGDEALCGLCRADLPWLRGTRCGRCGLPSPCAPCPAAGTAVEAAWAPLAYAGAARAVVAALKFDGATALAPVMAAQIAATVPDGLIADRTVVPVPGHPGRARARGFDQANVIATALARRAGLPVARCLVRGGDRGPQQEAPRSERLAPGRLPIAVRGRPPAAVLLVDDVHTTGATLDACARALRAAGCGSVVAVAYARTLRGATADNRQRRA